MTALDSEFDIVIVKNTSSGVPDSLILENAVQRPVGDLKYEFTDNVISTPIAKKIVLNLDIERVQATFTLTGTIVGEVNKIDFEDKVTNQFLGSNGVTLFWPMRFDAGGAVKPIADQDRQYRCNVTRCEITQTAGEGGPEDPNAGSLEDFAYHYTLVLIGNVQSGRRTIQKGT